MSTSSGSSGASGTSDAAAMAQSTGSSGAGSGSICLANNAPVACSSLASSTASRNSALVWARKRRQPVVQAWFLSLRSVTARAAHSTEDWRRHALFMTRPSNEPSMTVRASGARLRLDAALEAAEDGQIAGLQVRSASWRDEAQYDVWERRPHGGQGGVAGVDAGHDPEKDPRLSFIAWVQHVIQCGCDLQERRRRGPAALRCDVMSVLRPRLLRQDGVCLARVHDLHQHLQRATVHAEGDRECRGLPGLSPLLNSLATVRERICVGSSSKCFVSVDPFCVDWSDVVLCHTWSLIHLFVHAKFTQILQLFSRASFTACQGSSFPVMSSKHLTNSFSSPASASIASCSGFVHSS